MTKGSLVTKKWREEFKARDPEGYKLFRRTESTKYKSQPEVKRKAAYRAWKATLNRVYKLTEEQWFKMYEDQNGLCALCGLPFEEEQRPAVDHNHTTGKVRALLHKYPCNLLIGYIENYGHLVKSAEIYLTKYNS